MSAFASAHAANAQQFEQPTARTRTVTPIDGIDQVVEAPLDREAILREDQKREEEGLPPRYAVPQAVFLSPASSGTWEQLDNQTLLWRLRISSPDATSINLGFTRYHMPDGGRLQIYAADFSHIIRPFDHADNAAHGELWTPPVAGESTIVEVTIPAQFAPLLDLEIGWINVGYRPFMIPPELALQHPIERSGACNIDVKCPQGLPWTDQIQAVGVISTGGSTFCTGFMVNNTSGDLKPYFMTAAHCGVNSGNAASLVVFWNYQNSFCRPPGSPQSGQPGDGSLSTFQTGSFFRASASVSDFTLVELDESPNPAWNISFAGWSREDRFPPNGACIHHPSTDEKRITFYDVADRPDRPSHSSSWGCSAFPGPGDGSHIRVYWKLEGAVTEPGSSGSPLFDENKRVIGQLHGGPSACGATGDSLSDCYGRIWRSWTGSGTSASRLSDWLDPTGTGALVTDTISGGGINVNPTVGPTHVGVVGGPFTNPSTVYTLSNQTPAAANYTVSLVPGGTAPLLINGGSGPISGTVPSGGPSVNVTVSLNSSANSLPAGIYTTTVRFQDTTNNITSDRVHRLEVGQTGFTTSPANGLISGGPTGGPFNATQVYTLTSTQPTPVNIQVSANQPWISLNGGSGPLNLNLSGTGASTTVTVGFSAAANSLPSGLHNGVVTFTNQSGGSGNTTRPVQLDVGRYSYSSTDTPIPINDFSTINSVINVPDNYCIADVNVEVNITHTYIGDLIVEVISPTGIVVRLHNRTGGTTDNINRTYDDGVVNPDGPGVLADFIGVPVNGNWTLRVSDNASQDVGSLDNWKLKIAAGSCGPATQLVHSFPLTTNPGWSVQGGWAYGQPQGLGGDPTSGFTGPNVYGYNLAGAYSNNMGATEYLTTTAINCSNLTGTRLRFRRWLGVEHSTYDHARIEVSNNGTSWTSIWNNPAGGGNSIIETSWSYQSYNISLVADNQPTVYIRWGLGPTDDSVVFCGWNIDDVEIWAAVPCNLPGDLNNDGLVDALDIGPFTKVLLNPGGATPYELCAADLIDDNVVDMQDANELVNQLLAP